MRRTDAFPHCPDLLVNSTYWAETDEVAAFEELVGSHGGMGGGQCFPFVLFPPSSTARRSPSSAPSACTGCSAAGWPRSATTPTPTGRGLARLEHAHLDLGRDGGHVSRELVRRVREPVAAPRVAAG